MSMPSGSSAIPTCRLRLVGLPNLSPFQCNPFFLPGMARRRRIPINSGLPSVAVARAREVGSRQAKSTSGSQRSHGIHGSHRPMITRMLMARLTACTAQLQRLILCHEDSINIAKSEVSFVAHFRIDAPNSLVKSIFEAANTWRKTRETAPQSVNKPLRAALLWCIFKELRTRISEMSTEQSKRLESVGWHDPSTQVWSYLK